MSIDYDLLTRAFIGSAVFCWAGSIAFKGGKVLESMVWWIMMIVVLVFSSVSPLADQEWITLLLLAGIFVAELGVILVRIRSLA